MRSVSPTFITALDASERQLDSKVFMIFREFNSLCTSIDPCLPATGNIFNAAQVTDNRLCMQDFMGRPRPFPVAIDEPNKRFQTSSGSWINLIDSGSYQAVTDMALIPSIHTQKPGWWSANTTDAQGITNMALTVSLASTQSINCIFYVCDPAWGIPVNFTLNVIKGATKTTVATITGNTDHIIFYELGQYYQADAIQIQITKWSLPNSHIKALQFVPIDGADVTDRLIKWDLTEERNYTDQQSLPYGDSSKNKIVLTLDNTDGAFFSRNFKSPYYRKLRVNTKFRIYLGLKLPDQSIEWTNRGAYYAIGNFDSSAKSAEVSIEAWDISGRLDQTDYLAPVIYSLGASNPNTILTLVDTVVSFYNQSFGTNLVVEDRTKFDDRGRYVSDWNSIFSYSSGSYPSSGVPNAYFQKQSYWKTLRDLADSILGWVNVSEEETIIIDSEFMAQRTFNMLTNGNFESVKGVNDGWTMETGASLSYADQRVVFDGTNSGELFTTFQEQGIRQRLSDPLGIDGDYNFRAWYLTNSGNLHCQILGLDAGNNVKYSYYDQRLTSASWSLLYQDFTVTPDVTTLEVRFRQSGGTHGDFLLDNVSISTAAVASFVGEPVPGYTEFTNDNINMADIQDKFTVDKITNQVTVIGSPFRLGVGTTTLSYDGNRLLYYGTSFPGHIYSETLGLSESDSAVVGGKLQLTHGGVQYFATVMDNDPAISLYGPTPMVQPTSGTWAALNTSYYYRVTALNANGESTPGPVVAVSFPSGQQQPQISIGANQNCVQFRVYRSLTSFGSGDTVSYIDLGVSQVVMSGPATSFAVGTTNVHLIYPPNLPAGALIVSTSPDNAGNPQIVFQDLQTYSGTRVVPSTNTATKPPSLYLDAVPLNAQSFALAAPATNDSFVVFPFEDVFTQQAPNVTVINPALIIPVGGSYSFTFTYSKTPVYVATTPTSWNYIGPGFYRTPEGIELGFNNLNDSGGSVSSIGLTLDTVNSVLYPFGGTLWFKNQGSGPLQVTDISISAPVMTQTGSFQAVSTNQPLIDQVGLKDQTITSPFIQSISLASAIADRVLTRWSGPGREYDIDMPNRAPLHLQLGDKVVVWDDHTVTHGAQFLITRVETTFDGGASGKISVVSID